MNAAKLPLLADDDRPSIISRNSTTRSVTRAGDEVLRGVARVLSNSMRDVDLVARYRLERNFRRDLPATKAEEAKRAVERPVQPSRRARFAAVRRFVGHRQLRSGRDYSREKTFRPWFSVADQALYASKEAGPELQPLSYRCSLPPHKPIEQVGRHRRSLLLPKLPRLNRKPTCHALRTLSIRFAAHSSSVCRRPSPGPIAAIDVASSESSPTSLPFLTSEPEYMQPIATLEVRNQSQPIRPAFG